MLFCPFLSGGCRDTRGVDAMWVLARPAVVSLRIPSFGAGLLLLGLPPTSGSGEGVVVPPGHCTTHPWCLFSSTCPRAWCCRNACNCSTTFFQLQPQQVVFIAQCWQQNCLFVPRTLHLTWGALAGLVDERHHQQMMIGAALYSHRNLMTAA